MVPEITPAARPPRKSRLPLILVSVFLGMVLLMGGCIAAIVVGVKNASSGGTVVAGRFLDEVMRHDRDAAYAELSPNARKATDRSTFDDLIGLLEKHNGKITAHSDATSTYVSNDNGVVTARLGYNLTTEKKSVPATITAVRDGDRWQIQGFHFNP